MLLVVFGVTVSPVSKDKMIYVGNSAHTVNLRDTMRLREVERERDR